MDLKNKKIICELYGLLRIVWGSGQIVGLFAGFFLLEWIIKYPLGAQSALIIDKDLIALTYLTVLFRSIFHIVSGIGIARNQLWSRMWITLGWPIMIIVTIGFTQALFNQWSSDALVTTSFVRILSPLRILIYIGIIAFDYMLISTYIKELETTEVVDKEIRTRLEFPKIGLVAGITIVSFAIVMFMGSPIKKGFHKGFYKARGKVTQSKKPTNVLKEKQEEVKVSTTITKAKKEQTKPQVDDIKVIDVVKDKIEEVEKSELKNEKIVSRKVEKVKKEKIQTGMPYRKFLGVMAGLLINVAFLLQLLDIRQNSSARNISLSVYLLFTVGFLLLFIYGYANRNFSLGMPSLISFALCLLIMITKIQEEI